MVNGVRAGESERRKNMAVFGWDDFMEVDRWLAIHQWSSEDVFDTHKRHAILPNPLYKQGMSRVGCFPCIHARKPELRQMAIRYPEAFERLNQMELDVSSASKRGISSFFAADKASERFRMNQCEATGIRFARAPDIKRWALDADPEAQGSMFEELGVDLEAPACLSRYRLCE